MTAVASARRARHGLLRDRVRAVALQFEAEPGPMWFESESEPRSLAPLVRAEFERRGLRGAERTLGEYGEALARWALVRDPSTRVAATFAVATTLDLIAQRALRGDDAAASYRNGMSASACSTAYGRGDLARLRLLPSDLAATRTVVQATWSPGFETPAHLYDPVRPPLEALAFASLHVGSSDAAPLGDVREVCFAARDVLGIGLGLSAGPQALSAMLPDATLYSDATPYHSAPVSPREWKAVVLNVPRASAYEVASHLGAGGSDAEVSVRVFGDTRARARRNLDGRVDHVPVLVGKLAEHAHSGATVVVLADPEVHPVVEVALAEAGLRRSELRVGERSVPALYVGSGVRCGGERRRSRGLPAPTARIVTVWGMP